MFCCRPLDLFSSDSNDKCIQIEGEVCKQVFDLCETCGGGYIQCTWRVPIEQLASDDLHDHGKHFQEAQAIRAGETPCFGPASVCSRQLVVFGFKRKCSFLNKNEYLSEMKTNATMRNTRYVKKGTAPMEDGSGKRETVYIFEFNPSLMHRRTCSMKWLGQDEKIDHVMTPDTQKFASLADILVNFVVKDHLESFGGQYLIDKLTDFQS